MTMGMAGSILLLGMVMADASLSLGSVVSIGLTVGLGIACLYVWAIGEEKAEAGSESASEAGSDFEEGEGAGG